MCLIRAVVSPLVISALVAAFVGTGCGGIGMIGSDAGGAKPGGGSGGNLGSGGTGGGDNGTGGDDNGTGGSDNGSGGSDHGTGGSDHGTGGSGTGGSGTGGAASDGGVDKAPTDAPADRPKTDAGTGGADARLDAPADTPQIETAPEAMPETEPQPDAPDDGNGPPFFPVAPCATSDLYTAAAGTTATITFAPFAYMPACLKIKKGAMVTFSGSFDDHPLVADTPLGTTAASSIIDTSTGSSRTFALPDAGFFPYFCMRHQDEDMLGVIWVTE